MVTVIYINVVTCPLSMRTVLKVKGLDIYIPPLTGKPIFCSEYYQILIGTHLPTPEGWKAELA